MKQHSLHAYRMEAVLLLGKAVHLEVYFEFYSEGMADGFIFKQGMDELKRKRLKE